MYGKIKIAKNDNFGRIWLNKREKDEAMIGREWERKELLRRYERNKPEFIAVYGRRRVGKTFLIDNTFEN